jgi:DNA (cytosine-5)-methyltransferase 1
MTLTVGSLFSGIGGLDLGLERAGMKVIWQSEIDPYASQVLKKHWKDTPNYGDIKKIDWSRVERPAIICGGYPCQPFSQAGSRKGEEDSRHLFPWVFQAISTLRPDYCILENVRGHLSLGGTSVIAMLARIGYCSEWRIISAASVGAPHKRDRVIIVSYPEKLQRYGCTNYTTVSMGTESISKPGNSGRSDDISHTCGIGCMDTEADIFTSKRGLSSLSEFAPGSWWTTEPGMGRVADGVPSGVDRLKCLGNAVVPQVAEVVGRLVMNHAKAI